MRIVDLASVVAKKTKALLVEMRHDWFFAALVILFGVGFIHEVYERGLGWLAGMIITGAVLFGIIYFFIWRADQKAKRVRR